MAVSLAVEIIEAADGMYQRLEDWKASDRALLKLREALPGFSPEEILLKAVAVNAIYGTFVWKIWGAARHIKSVFEDRDIHSASIEDIDEIAKVPGTNRRFSSFASKFAHFFIDEERFPIKDSFAENIIRYHLGRGKWQYFENRPYYEYVTNFDTLKERSGYDGPNRKLDRYFWIAGQYRVWKKKKDKAEINEEVKKLFKQPDQSPEFRRFEQLFNGSIERKI